MTKKNLESVIPYFLGFYYSELDDLIDQEIECRMGCDGKTYEELEPEMNYTAAKLAICKGWVSAFSSETGVEMEMESVSSPKEYNFTTDRLFVRIPLKECRRLHKELFHSEEFASVLNRWFTSRDGFISWYPNYIEADKWQKPVKEWDHNQISALLAALVDRDHGGEKKFNNSLLGRPCVYKAAANHLWDAKPALA